MLWQLDTCVAQRVLWLSYASCSLHLWVRLRTGFTKTGSTTYNLLVVGSRVAQIDVDIPFVARAMVALLEQLSLFRTQQLTNSWFDSISICCLLVVGFTNVMII